MGEKKTIGVCHTDGKERKRKKVPERRRVQDPVPNGKHGKMGKTQQILKGGKKEGDSQPRICG